MSVDVLRAGSQLAELMPSDRPGGYTVARVGTINEIHGSDGYLTADVLLSGGELLGLQLTTACVNARPGDRCVVEFYANIGVVTGVLARPGVDAPLFEWSSTWSGTPGTEPERGYLEKTATVTCGGLILCEVAAAINGTGEYCMAFDFLDANGERKAYWCSTSPQKNGGTLRWVASGSVRLPYGSYTVKLTTFHWGTVSIVGNDSSGNSLRWRDASLGVGGVSRYARLRMA